MRTRLEAHQWLIAHGVSIREFSRVHNIKRQIVNDVLAGRTKGLRGEAHRAMVLLGIKAAPSGMSPLDTPLETPLDATPSRQNKSTRQEHRHG